MDEPDVGDDPRSVALLTLFELVIWAGVLGALALLANAVARR